MTFAAFDVLEVAGREVMAEPRTDRRKRLEDLFPDGVTDARVQLVPTFEDAARLWRVWVVEWGGEGIGHLPTRDTVAGLVVGPNTSSSCPWRSSTALLSWSGGGDWGQAAVMAFTYRDPRTGKTVTVEQAVRVFPCSRLAPLRGPAEILCWGVLRTGLLRHPLLSAWTPTDRA